MGGTLLRLVLTRTLFGLGTLLVVSAVIFFTVGLLPGDFATEILGQAATPETVAALLRLFLSVKYNWFYSLASINAGMGFVEILQRIALPVLTLTLVITAHMMRMTRAAIIGVLSHPYIEMARCKGLSPRRIILR